METLKAAIQQNSRIILSTLAALCFSLSATVIIVGFLSLQIPSLSRNDSVATATIKLSPKSLDLGVVPAQETRTVIIEARNLLDREIRLVGVRTSCGCFVTNSVPACVEPRGHIDLEFRLEAPNVEEDTRVKYTVEVFVDGLGWSDPATILAELQRAVESNENTLQPVPLAFRD